MIAFSPDPESVMCTALRMTVTGLCRGMEISFTECCFTTWNVMIGSFLDDESIPEISKTIKLILFEILSAWGTHLYCTLSNCKVSTPRIFYNSAQNYSLNIAESSQNVKRECRIYINLVWSCWVTCRASLSAHINGLIQRILNLVPKDFKSKKFERLFPFSKQKDRGIYERLSFQVWSVRNI